MSCSGFTKIIARNRRGQTVVEFAAFGSALILILSVLVAYAMSSIQSQAFQMKGFRKAFVRASTREAFGKRRGAFNPGWEFENAEPAAPGNHWLSASYVVLEDKPSVSVSGALPIGRRVPLGMSKGAMRTIDLFAEPEPFPADPDDPDSPAARDLPRVEFEINGMFYSFSSAGFKEYAQEELGQLYIKQDIANWDGSGSSWSWVATTFEEIAQGDYVDVDGDYFEEYVMLKDAGAGRLGVLDYQDGDISFSEPIVEGGRPEGGLQDNYSKRFEVYPDSSFRRQENAEGITTTERLHYNETIDRALLLKEGYEDIEGNVYADGMYPVSSALVIDKTTTWTTPH